MVNKQESIPYEEAFEALNKAGINYAVCGGLAVVLYGYARLTVDLDLIVSLEKENLEKLYDTLIGLDYKLQIPIKKETFIEKKNLEKLAEEKNMKVVSFYSLRDNFKVIDIGVNLPDIDKILRMKKQIKINNLRVPIISIKDLIKMKEDLARPRDLTDVENLKKSKKQSDIDGHLLYIIKNTTPYERLIWLKKTNIIINSLKTYGHRTTNRK